MAFLSTTTNVSCLCLLLLILTFGVALANATTPSSSSSSSSSSPASFYPRGRDRPHDYEIINEEVHYSGWRKVIRRSVNAINKPHQKIIHFDIIDQASSSTSGAVIVFAWNSTSKTATIVREYMPGPHRVLSGLAAGIVEDGKHSSMEGSGDDPILVAARYELEEECHLAGGTWYRLTEEGVSVPMDKYVVTEITPYLVIDAEHVPNPRPLDEEEDIEIVRGVTAEELLQMIREGDFNLVGGWGALLAIEKLRELGEI